MILLLPDAARRSVLCYGVAPGLQDALWRRAAVASVGAALLDTNEFLLHRPSGAFLSLARAHGCVLRAVGPDDASRLRGAVRRRRSGRQRFFYRPVPRLAVAGEDDSTDCDGGSSTRGGADDDDDGGVVQWTTQTEEGEQRRLR